MGLLRAFAEVVLIGAGTYRAEGRHRWTPDRAHPPAAAGYAKLRRELGRPEELPLAVVTASGEVDPGLPALAGGMLLTTRAGEARLRGRTPAGVRVEVAGEGDRVAPADALAVLRRAGYRSILTEGGPHLFGEMVRDGLVDQLFLTLAPVIAGRERNGPATSLAEGVALLPGIDRRAELLGVRRGGPLLFLRYRLR